MNFKLLAIRPLDDCNEKFLKNLKENTIYKLSNDCNFFLDENENVIQIDYNPFIPENFFSINKNNQKSNVNISAIVGKNGSGKSALIELLIASIVKLSLEINSNFIEIKNLYSDYSELKSKLKIKEFEKSLLEDLDRINIEIFYYNNQFIAPFKKKIRKIQIKENRISIKDFIDKNQSNEFRLLNEEILTKIFKKKTGRDNIKLSDEEIRFFKDFFYSIIINYSHFSYNTLEMGEWLKGVFHKNDGYQLPIVINPYRNKGIIDINSEKYLTSSRFLVNILQEKKLRKISEEKRIKYVSIEIDKNKFKWDENRKLDKQIFSGKLLKQEILKFTLEKFGYLESEKKIDNNNHLYPYLRDYIIKKLIKTTHYPIYSDFKDCFREERGTYFLINSKKKKFFNYIEILSDDFSHNTDKLRQALFFIYNIYLDEYDVFDFKKNIKLLNIDSLYEKINFSWEIFKKDFQIKSLFDNESFSIKESLPSIFKINYFFDKKYSKNNFDNLSSGEKQKIYSIHSIIYHYRNLKSVKEIYNINTEEKKYTNKLIYYKNVNIIFDEIELYAHPEYQKKFIYDFLFAINSLNKISDSLNVIFITHSPFILSDIPKQNVLFLDEGKPVNIIDEMNTFGANITNLLADSFFIEDGLIGDFAKEKIGITLEWLKMKANQRIQNLFPKIDKDLQNKIPHFNKESDEIEYHKKIIKLVDEPLVKNKLQEMFIEFVSEDSEFKDEQIRQLEEKLRKLKEE